MRGRYFAAFESGLTVELLSAILAGARPSGRADLIMPRFKFQGRVVDPSK
jgi:hypothetical protein